MIGIRYGILHGKASWRRELQEPHIARCFECFYD